MYCKVFLRGKQQDVLVDNPATVGKLRQVVLQQLQSTPIKVNKSGNEKTLLNQEILLFQNGSETPLQEEEENLSKEVTYTAYEKFNTVPVDLYRTVKLSQIHPAVRSFQPTAFSVTVPLYCAALTEKEAEYPPYYMNHQRVLVRGASLHRCNSYTKDTTIMPWDEITQNEEKGESRVNLEHPDFQNTYKFDASSSPFGILHTLKLYMPESIESFRLFDHKESKNTVVKKRFCFWRFKLPKGTDLQDVGMSVICDNHDGHFSLIPNKNRSLSSTEICEPLRQWAVTEPLRHPHLLAPQPDVQDPPPPEAIAKINGSAIFAAFPVVAAQKFQFHGLVMKASGQPWDMDFGGGDDDNQDKKKLGVASNVVFEYCIVLPDTYDILCALDALRTSEFNMKSVSTSDFDFLRSTMDELLSTDDTIDEAGEEILIDGIGAIDNLLKSRAGGTPPLAEVPYAGPPLKVARTE